MKRDPWFRTPTGRKPANGNRQRRVMAAQHEALPPSAWYDHKGEAAPKVSK